MPRRTIGHAIVGFGFMGHTHAYALRALPLLTPDAGFAVRPVALCARRIEAIEGPARELGYAYATDDFARILDDPDVDSVSICTPNDSHERYAVAALRAGKHVYLEKPVAHDLDSARRIEAAWRASGRACGVVFNNRFFPSALRAVRMAREGRLGRILAVRACYLHAGAVDANAALGWKHDADVCGGGSMLDLGTHAIDLIEALAGPISGVCAAMQTQAGARASRYGGTIGRVGEDAAYLLLAFPDGGRGTLEASKIATGAQDELRIEVDGTLGALRLDLIDPNWLWYYDNTKPEAPLGGERGWQRIECVQRYEEPSFLPPKNAVGWSRSHAHGLYAFLDAVSRGTQPCPDLSAGMRAQIVSDAAYRSAASGGWVDC